MPTVHAKQAHSLPDNCYSSTHDPRWRHMHRIDTTGANVQAVIDAIHNYPFERLVFAEGDSWFDKFTPIGLPDTNLLDAIRVPYFAGVVDVSHIGDIAADMVRGQQRQQTQAMFKMFDFDAILFSGGGNDLKNLFADLYQHKAPSGQATGSPQTVQLATKLKRLDAPDADDFFDEVIENIKQFVALRDSAGSERTRNAPILVNGYDYFQPRPAGGNLLGGMLKLAGPWLYPVMKMAGLSDIQMLSAARVAIDKLNARLQAEIAELPNVYVVDQRGLLTLAEGGSKAESGDWLDEIHPSAQGFNKLARNRWDCLLAQKLGWLDTKAEGQPACDAK